MFARHSTAAAVLFALIVAQCESSPPCGNGVADMDTGVCDPGDTCSLTVVARARVTCAAATDDDSGVVCNTANVNFMGQSFPSDDPDTPNPDDAALA